jgi:hypothetical protein
MATKSLYFKNAAPSGAATSLSLQDGGTAPATGITATGWVVARLTATNLSAMLAGTERASNTFSAADAIGSFAASACWRSENPFTGTFANANWTLAFRVRAVTAASAQTGRIKLRVWKSSNAAGTGATQLTSAVLTGTTTAALSTTVSQTSTVTWTPGSTVVLANEYLWVQCEWDIVVASGSNTGDVDFFIESAGVITTPNFVVSYAMPAVTAPIAVTAQPADLDADRRLAADAGAIALAGNAATLLYGRSFGLPAAAGAVAVTGVDAVLRHRRSYALLSSAGAVTVEGVDATLRLRRSYAMLADPGAVAVTGNGATFGTISNKAMLAAIGSVAIAGADADLIYVALPAAAVLVAQTGAVTLAGYDAILDVDRAAPPLAPIGPIVFGRPRAERMNVFRW